MSERAFRVCIIGGYNKADVTEYIRALEEELEELREKAKAGVSPETAGQCLEAAVAALETAGQQPEAAGGAQGTPGVADVPAAAAGAAASERPETAEYLRLQEENQRLREELESMKDRRTRSEEDYEAIKKVLLDARVDAGVITAKAQERANQMIAETEEYLEKRKRQAIAEFCKEMENRGIELLTSKYKIQAQMENLEKAYEELRQVRQYMADVVNNIPSGIESIMMEVGLEELAESRQEEPSKRNAGRTPGNGKPEPAKEEPSGSGGLESGEETLSVKTAPECVQKEE